MREMIENWQNPRPSPTDSIRKSNFQVPANTINLTVSLLIIAPSTQGHSQSSQRSSSVSVDRHSHHNPINIYNNDPTQQTVKRFSCRWSFLSKFKNPTENEPNWIEARTKRENTFCCAILDDQGGCKYVQPPKSFSLNWAECQLCLRTVIQIQIHLNPSERANLQIWIHLRVQIETRPVADMQMGEVEAPGMHSKMNTYHTNTDMNTNTIQVQIQIVKNTDANGGGGSTRDAFQRQMGISLLIHFSTHSPSTKKIICQIKLSTFYYCRIFSIQKIIKIFGIFLGLPPPDFNMV